MTNIYTQQNCSVDGKMEHPAMLPYPKKIQVEVTTRCNMHCSMCVKYAPGSIIPEADLDLDSFRNLGPALAHCETLVLNGIGEPLLHPQLSEMAKFARERMPAHGSIGFQTNGLLFTEEKADRMVKSGVDTFCISVDSLDSDNCGDGELHGQTCVDRLARSFAQLKAAGKKHGLSLRLGIEFVLMADTIEQLPEVVRWAAAQGAGFVVCSHVLAHDKSMQSQSLFNPNTPKASALFSKWQEIAMQQGLNLHDYYNVVWKFIKSESDKKLSELVMGMLAEAKEQEIWMHMRSLLDWDKRHQSETGKAVEKILSTTRKIADEAGMELRMPPFMASEELSCRFVEDGAAFVTSQGDISPCQFLWHSYACYLDGSEKQIKPKVFGNLAEDKFEEIWRSANYSDFRAEVLEYAYPYCSSCPMVPCDDITGKSYDFENDCLGAKVPCGHCPWAMGGLQCLL